MSEELEEVYGLDDSEGSPAGTCDPLCSVDEMSSVDFEANFKPNSDIIKAVSVGALALATTAIVQHSWVAENQASCCRVSRVERGLDLDSHCHGM